MIRNLAEFRNADGQAPNGRDDGMDDSVAGSGVNRIAGNYVIPCEIASEFIFSPSTIVQANFTAEGPWEKNTT